MREVKDCTEEVFRRSKMRIRQRRQRRNHILMACIPLALCISLFSTFVLPGMLNGNRDSGIESENWHSIDGMENTGAAVFAGKVQVLGAEISLTYTSEESVGIITGLIHEILSKPETNNETLQDYIASESSSGDLQNASKDHGYRITVTKGDGTVAEYKLMGEYLIDQSTNTDFCLTEEESAELRNALGIPSSEKN